MENKKKVYLTIGIFVAIVLVIGISYALWTFNITQSGVNTITSGCLKLEMTNESEAITLTNTYPISDEEGLKLTPYSFTLTNTCSSDASYNLSLEMMETENKLATNYIAVSVDNGSKQILSNLDETELTYNKGDYTSYEGRLLLSGTLKGNESKEHTIRIWLDEGTPAIDEAMNKTLISKVVLNATIKELTNEEKFDNAITNSNKAASVSIVENSHLIPDELAYDGTVDNNLRYIGANPNNYVLFNNELWRIIGVMNNIKDSNGNTGSYVKIIRNESIGEYYWSGSFSNKSNDWTKSTLNTEILNGTYYNGLTDEAKGMIASIVWNLGGVSARELPASTFYAKERGTEVYEGRPTTWTGKVGLMYPSDYGYAIGVSVRETCLITNLYNYNTNDCYTNDWLYINDFQWTLTPYSGFANDAFCVLKDGKLACNYVYNIASAIRPVLYLNSNVKLTGIGDGSESSPYELSVQ